MRQIKAIRILPAIAVFAGLAAGVFIWRCALTAFLWAGWGGFGGVSMVYTIQGERASQIILGVPILILLFLLLIRLTRNKIKREPTSRYGKDLFFFIAAVSVGILFFHIPEPRQTIIDAFARGIAQAGWLQYPAP